MCSVLSDVPSETLFNRTNCKLFPLSAAAVDQIERRFFYEEGFSSWFQSQMILKPRMEDLATEQTWFLRILYLWISGSNVLSTNQMSRTQHTYISWSLGSQNMTCSFLLLKLAEEKVSHKISIRGGLFILEAKLWKGICIRSATSTVGMWIDAFKLAGEVFNKVQDITKFWSDQKWGENS